MSPIKRRREKKRILIVTPEITYLPSDMGNMANYSSAKAGGLADVSGSLPIALHALKRGKNRLLDVRLVLPAYPDAVRAAGLDREVGLPMHLCDLFEREERMEILPNELSAVQAFMADNINA